VDLRDTFEDVALTLRKKIDAGSPAF
jgi:hypothetical protein